MSAMIESKEETKEAYERGCVTYDMTHLDLLQRVVDDDHLNKNFCGALAWIFGIDPMIVGHLACLDLICVPDVEEDEPMNWIQFILKEGEHGAYPIEVVLSYLFDKGEPIYHEPYDYTERQKARIEEAHKGILLDHGSADAYFECVSQFLWREKNYLASNYSGYLVKARKLLI
jgi:hypothetical protein